MATLGFFGFCFYVFAFYSRILDLAMPQLHLPGFAFGFAILMAVLSGRIIEVLQDRIAVYLVGLSCWLVIAIPGAYWRGGSFTVLTRSWIPAMLLFLVAGAVNATLTWCRRSLYVLGLSIAAGALLVSLRGRMIDERLMLEGSRYTNSNTIAIVLLMGIPLVWLLAANSRAGMFRKVLAGGVLILMLVALFRTGSREGLIGLAVLYAIAFLRSSLFGKLRLVIALMALLAGTALFLPRSLKSRFATIFESATVEIQGAQTLAERNLLVSAGGSSETRWALLVDSLELTLQHPLLGVGPGNFAPYMADQAKLRGGFGLWVGTHNTYTQLSSEVGIPGLCLFLAVLVSSMLALGGISRRARRIPGKEASDIATMALALQTSFVAFCVCALFNHMAYELTIPLMAGITVAIRRAAPDELSRLEDAERRQEGAPDSFLQVLPNRSRVVAG
jgi:O-antigen ligase